MVKEKKADVLLQIISNMSRDEKRYFTINATNYQREDESAVLELFDAICEMLAKSKTENLEFDEVVRHLKKPIAAARLSNIKAKLKKQLQQSLAEKTREDYNETYLMLELEQAATMSKRSFYMEAFSIIQSVLNRSQAAEFFQVTSQGLQQLIDIYPQVQQQTGLNLLDLISRHRVAVQQYQNLCWIQQQSALLSHLYTEGVLGSSDERYQRITELANSADLNDPNFAQSATARYFQVRAMIYYSHKTKDYSRIETLSNEMMQVMEPMLQHNAIHLQRYYIALAEAITSAMIPPPRLDFARNMLQKMHAIWQEPQHRKTIESDYTYLYGRITSDLQFYDREKNIPALLACLDEYTVKYVQLSKQIPASNAVYLQYLFARINLVTGRYNECLKNVHNIQRFVNTGAWPDVVNGSFILEILLHYTEGNYDLVDTLLRRTKRHFKNYYGTPDRFQYIWHVSSFIKQLLGARSKEEKQQTLNEWHDFLEPHQTHSFNDLQNNLTHMSLSRSWLRMMLGV